MSGIATIREGAVVHLIGISGIGMSALARILLQRGHRVSGSSDRQTALTEMLVHEGARVEIGHAAGNLGDANVVVVSSAIGAGNPELIEAQQRGLAVIKRGALLAELVNERRGIAIAGTHGKTTTTAMLATVLEAGGLAPSYAIGGERIDTQTNACHSDGPWFVAESDESDGSFMAMRPQIAVLTNIENDHVSGDDELAALIGSFDAFLAALPVDGLALIGIDEPAAASLVGHARSARTLTYGLSGGDLVARELHEAQFGSTFAVELNGQRLGAVRLSVPGAINVFDALPSVLVGMELGLSFATVTQALGEFRGVRRRFEILARAPRMIVVDDYAHHPTAVAATIAAARKTFAGPIVVAFQPHRYTRTHYLGAGFAQALSGADYVVLTDVYAASEVPIPGVDAKTIGEPLRAGGADVAYVDVAALPTYLAEHAPYGSLVLMLGAGSITGAAATLAQHVRDGAQAAVS
ncbi:MAG TPA: UDP-N-acetylmuramate--L-alanine ligase [Candidatus Baltobacteraceae bacterium]